MTYSFLSFCVTMVKHLLFCCCCLFSLIEILLGIYVSYCRARLLLCRVAAGELIWLELLIPFTGASAEQAAGGCRACPCLDAILAGLCWNNIKSAGTKLKEISTRIYNRWCPQEVPVWGVLELGFAWTARMFPEWLSKDVVSLQKLCVAFSVSV